MTSSVQISPAMNMASELEVETSECKRSECKILSRMRSWEVILNKIRRESLKSFIIIIIIIIIIKYADY